MLLLQTSVAVEGGDAPLRDRVGRVHPLVPAHGLCAAGMSLIN